MRTTLYKTYLKGCYGECIMNVLEIVFGIRSTFRRTFFKTSLISNSKVSQRISLIGEYLKAISGHEYSNV